MLKPIWALLLASSLLAALTACTPEADRVAIRESRDRADITKHIWDYVQAMDNLDVDAYPTFFTEDGSICCENNKVYKGHAEIRLLLEEVRQNQEAAKARGETVRKMYHPIFNFQIEFKDKDHARVNSYWFTVFADKPPNSEPNVVMVGRCEDDVVRVNGKWLIQSRNVFP
jgi:SnoaL-like domain